MYILVLELFNLFCAGMLAGIEVAVHYVFHKPTIALAEKPQITLRQGLIRTLRWLVPAFFVPMVLSGIAITIIRWGTPGLCFHLTAILAIILWTIIRVIGTVPVNAAMLGWNPDDPPKDWRARINKVERFHVIGTWASILAFVFFLASSMAIGSP